MAATEKLLKIYEDVLMYGGMMSNDKGYVVDIADKDQIFVDGFQLVKPTDFQMKGNSDRERIIMHPFAENNILGESNLIKKLRFAINIRLNVVISRIGQGLLAIVANPKHHSHLNPEQLQLLTRISSADMTSITNFAATAVALMKEGPDRAFAHIFLSRGGTMRGQKYARLGVATFPYYRNLLEGKMPKGRDKDKETFKQLMEFMFEGLDKENEYSHGSDSPIAPFFQALLLSSAKLAGRLNELAGIYKKFLVSDELKEEDITFNMDWLHDIMTMDELGADIRSVPPQNDGAVAIREAAPTTQSVPVTANVNHLQQNNAPMMQMQQPAQEVVKTKDGLDFRSFLGGAAPQPQQVFPTQQQMMPQGQMLPNGMMMMPNGQVVNPAMMQQPMMPQGMMQPGMMMPNGMMMPQQMMQQPPTPTWAQPDPSLVMVMTQQGMMTQAAANQFKVPYQIIQQPQQQGMMMNNGMMGGGMNPVPTWGR